MNTVQMQFQDNEFNIVDVPPDIRDFGDLMFTSLICIAMNNSLRDEKLTLSECETLQQISNTNGPRAVLDWVNLNHPELIEDAKTT